MPFPMLAMMGMNMLSGMNQGQGQDQPGGGFGFGGLTGGMAGLGSLIGLQSLLGGSNDPVIRRGDAQGVSSALARFLTERLNTEPVDTKSFRRMSTALREGLRGQGGAAVQGLSETAQARGFQDSGEVIGGIGNIRRGELQGFASGTRDILEMLEARRLAGVLPFLQIASGENASQGRQGIARSGQAMAGTQGTTSQLIDFGQLATGG